MTPENSALEELKRVDHLIFVTLKYTRTVDVIRNVLQRLVSTMDFQIADTLEHFRKKGKLAAVSPATLIRCRKLEELFPKDQEIKNMIDFYMELKKLVTSEYKKKEEYRKNVAMITKEAEITIDKLRDYADETKRYINYLREMMNEGAKK
ncbi:MAG: hypothetical protein PHO02_01685 [Candidatus Nanoarchaeia archaeon]|nr:hypothetical protein [Candidatus Nanoarchaeia archaeon]